MEKYNVHAGHAASGKKYCGAVSLLNESKENRLIAKEIISLLKAAGNTVYDCTVDSGSSQANVLSKIAKKCNAHAVDFDFSIHLNSGRKDKKGDKKIGGFEVWLTDTGKGKGDLASRIRKEMKALGFTDRGTKKTSGLYILNHTKAPALLLEICFVDDKDDYNLYKEVGYKRIAQAVVTGITGKTVSSGSTATKPAESKPSAASKPEAAKSYSKSYGRKYTTTANLNLRSGAGENKEIITTIPKGKSVTCYGYYTNNGSTTWLYVQYGNKTGYCSKAYLK